MRKAKLVIPPSTAASLLSLLDIPDIERNAVDVILQASSANTADINLGTKVEQPGFITPGGAASLENISLKNTFVSGDGSNTLAILVLR